MEPSLCISVLCRRMSVGYCKGLLLFGLIILAIFSLGCEAVGGSDKSAQEAIAINSLPLKRVEGELVGRVWLEDGLLISVEETNGVVSEYLLRNRFDIKRLEETSLGVSLELDCYPNDGNSIPVVMTITVRDS